MNSKQAGIYLIVSKINGKRYIGSSVRICVRWSEHKSDLRLEFSYHIAEEAIKQIEYLKTLTNDELLKYKEECLVKPSRDPKNVKFYSWDKRSNKYSVQFTINGVKTYYGSYSTEQEAIDKVNELKQELGIK